MGFGCGRISLNKRGYKKENIFFRGRNSADFADAFVISGL
jgi:hypothetical protein